MTDAILVLNAGSSSVKFSVYPATEGAGTPIGRGAVDGIGHRIRLQARVADPAIPPVDRELAGDATHAHALSVLLDWIDDLGHGQRLVAAGHRVVHGGLNRAGPVLVTDAVMRELAALSPLAPLHQPHNLAAIAALGQTHPRLPQVACFDTSFHRTQSVVATTFALPRRLTAQGVRRYGFHGLSYEHIADVLPTHLGDAAEGRVVVAHLGHGTSMCALLERRSVATTMGFSALDGLVMGRRCGTIDPGVLLYLLQQQGMTAAEVSRLLYEQSGLLGVSGVSDDMRELLASPNPDAAEAVDLFVYRIGRELGSLAAALNGLDALVFTGGIGEHAAEIRRRVVAGAGWLGATLDGAANDSGQPRISPPGAAVSVWAIPTDEERMIARHTRQVAGLDSTPA